MSTTAYQISIFVNSGLYVVMVKMMSWMSKWRSTFSSPAKVTFTRYLKEDMDKIQATKKNLVSGFRLIKSEPPNSN